MNSTGDARPPCPGGTSGGHGEEPRLYRELADWWPLLSTPSHYTEEAALYRQVLMEVCERPPRTLLDLGSGGGNNASHLKEHFELTLVDRSPQMLAVSRALDPDPSDTSFIGDFAILLRERDGSVRIEQDRHHLGLFAREDWLRLLTEAGFRPRVIPFDHSELEPGALEVFVGVKPDTRPR